MAENWVTRSLRSIEEGDYTHTKVRGYNLEAAEYARENARSLRAEYDPNTVIAINGKRGKVVAQGKTIEEVLSAVGGLEKIQFPNVKNIMVGKVKDMVSAQRRFSKHLDFLKLLENAHSYHSTSYRL